MAHTDTFVAPPGLAGVIVADTGISDVDGANGRLTYRGLEIEQVVERFRWEGLLSWLIRAVPLEDSAPSASVRRTSPMASLSQVILEREGDWAPADPGSAYRMIRDVPLAFAQRMGPGVATPRREPPLAAQYVELLTGRPLSSAQARAIDAYWVMAAEHSLNASTFAVRVAASTGASLPLALVAGVATLSGPLHGGAPTGVLDLLDEAAQHREDLEAYLEAEVRSGKKLMGFGHRVYRAGDPRASALRSVFRELVGISERAQLAADVEHAATTVLKRLKPTRPLPVNVEFYAAVILDSLEIPRALCPPTFACARLAGWTAHYYEQRAEEHLIRPLARYRPT